MICTGNKVAAFIEGLEKIFSLNDRRLNERNVSMFSSAELLLFSGSRPNILFLKIEDSYNHLK